VTGATDVRIFGDRGVLRRAGLPDSFPVEEVTSLPPDDAAPGRPTPAGGAAQVAYLEAAVAAARRGELDAIVTAPISKKQAVAAGFAFPGHTEFLAERLGAPRVAMMFAGPKLRVVLATVHLPLAEVSRALTPEVVASAITLGHAALVRDFGISRPRIGVLGLNPHAGEDGLFGDEEARAIRPGILLSGIEADGPLVPDAAYRRPYDLFVAMYHDQGLIPVKLVDFDLSVNVTLGLPIVRTSPDHGVAYDIAARPDPDQKIVRHQSLAASLSLARQLVNNRLVSNRLR
jgi:4-hydroxythreonine-4-phosphate dehydrogenase